MDEENVTTGPNTVPTAHLGHSDKDRIKVAPGRGKEIYSTTDKSQRRSTIYRPQGRPDAPGLIGSSSGQFTVEERPLSRSPSNIHLTNVQGTYGGQSTYHQRDRE
ncbi:hypothetical protein M404DRAFT_1002262 [Pisolithus tinctorius Marx 270]|uniref:Uncharacterized protein n=1 Tax=Pisolithus tinctorius Marx 270 TaxID=870435 RepID=A0A0C3P4P8_PISTI|nr:hypothetical protein M404DRAFT_1002262 [Pisolithus tinctorius Marx 270]